MEDNTKIIYPSILVPDQFEWFVGLLKKVITFYKETLDEKLELKPGYLYQALALDANGPIMVELLSKKDTTISIHLYVAENIAKKNKEGGRVLKYFSNKTKKTYDVIEVYGPLDDFLPGWCDPNVNPIFASMYLAHLYYELTYEWFDRTKPVPVEIYTETVLGLGLSRYIDDLLERTKDVIEGRCPHIESGGEDYVAISKSFHDNFKIIKELIKKKLN